ncbi:MAG: diadenylate cyclase, partial [Candidatus Bipolaricaulia bacterium]
MKSNRIRELLSEIAPGTDMRKGLNRVVSQDHGGLIVLATREEAEEVINSGLELDEPFSPERLAEMSKMDGAIVLNR